MLPRPRGLRASPEHAGVGSCSQDRSHTPTEVPGASMQAEPLGQQTGAHRAGQPSPEPTAAPLRPAQQEKRCQTKRHATHTHTHTIRAGHTLSHLNYPLNRSVLTSSEGGAVRPWPTARENQPHRLTSPSPICPPQASLLGPAHL